MFLRLSLVIFSVFLLILPIHAQVDDLENFDKLKSDFQQKTSSSLGAETMQSWEKLSVYISKKIVSKAVTTAFNNSSVSVSIHIENASIDVPEPKTYKLKDIDQIDCSARCPKCDNDCGGFPGNIPCEAEKAAICRPLQATCLAAEAPVIAACEVLNAVKRAAGNVDLVTLKVKNLNGKADVSTSTIKLEIDEALTKTTFVSNFDAEARVQGNVNVSVAPLPGLLTACSPVQPTISIPSTKVTVNQKELSFDSTFEPLPTENGLKLQIALQKTELQLNTNISPFLSILRDNLFLFVTCNIAANALTFLGAIDHAFPFKNIRRYSPSFKLPDFTAGTISIDMPGRATKPMFVPKVTPLSLGVVEQ